MGDEMQRAKKEWWSSVCRQGDPLRRPNLVDEAFEAGWLAAKLEADEDDVERVARAIFAAGFSPSEDRGLIDQLWDDWTEDRERAIHHARAAILTMRRTFGPLKGKKSD